MCWLLFYVAWIVTWAVPLWMYKDDEIDSLERTIARMKVWQKNQEDREKQLLERIKFLESNQK